MPLRAIFLESDLYVVLLKNMSMLEVGCKRVKTKDNRFDRVIERMALNRDLIEEGV